MLKSPIIIATRQSELALWQAEFVKQALEKLSPELEVTLFGMTTRGDQWLEAPLSSFANRVSTFPRTGTISRSCLIACT